VRHAGWLAAEIQMVEDFASRGMPVKVIAERLTESGTLRTQRAVLRVGKKMGIRFHRNPI
jgi:hypothetical protein